MSRADLRVAFRTLGCKVNRVESDGIAAELLGRGVDVVEADAAQVIVINTCTVTGEADAKARKAVRQALACACDPVVVVTGCLASLDAPGLEALGTRVVVEADKTRVAARVESLLGADAARSAEPGSPVLRTGEGFRTRALLKIEDGCDNFCAYCIVPYARGVPRGMPLDDAVRDAQALVEAGVREIVLTGINIGRYRDPGTGSDLAGLIEQLASTGIERLRLSSIEPPDVTERLLGVLAGASAACEHLHVPLQSGSDAVLGRMGRRYTTAQFAETIERARTAIPGLAVTTDLIAGFPEETGEDHARTLEFVEAVGFSKLHVFRYSARPGTPAASRPQVAPQTRAERASQLRQRGEELRAAYVRSRLGSDVEVLVEARDEVGPYGMTRDYLRVRSQDGEAAAGSTVRQALRLEDVLLG